MEQSKASLRAVFCDAVEIPDPVARAAFLDSACAGDPGLRGQVERLLAADSNAGDFFSGRGDTPSPRELFSEQPGERIGRYRLIERIGRGGGGAVYLAEQEEPVRRRVALKILMLGMDTRSVVARFEAERQALAMMDHPNIAKVLDAGATETGRPFFVMELVSGQKLSEYCERKGLSIRERLELFIPVCRAVQHAHQKGIVHRDLKPSNILVTENEGAAVPKVIDFGIAKATQQDLSQPGLTSKDQFLGTPAYMSPEQVEYGGRDIDTRSDIYSLGVILYELLTGKPPFDPNELMRAGLDEMRRIIREVDPPKPSTTITKNFSRTGLPLPRKYSRERLAAVCGDMDWIAMKCLEKDRARRYETANGLAMDIRRHLDHEPVIARPPSQIYRFKKIVRRHRLGFAAAGIISLVLVAAVLVSSQLALRARRAEREQSRLRGVAENKAAESRQRLVRMNVTDGNRLAEQGDPLSALPWFVEALQMELDDPGRAEDSRLRISAALQQAPRLEHMIFHGRWINWIVFSPDGTRLATGANEYAARIWDAHTGELVLHLARQRGQIRMLKFSPDGKKLVTLDHTGTACLWDAFTGERLGSYLRPKDYAVGLLSSITSKLEPTACFSPDGKLLLVAWSSKSAGVWDASNQSLRHLLTHEQVVYHASFSPDGRYIVSCSQDGLAKIWDAQTGEPVGNPLRHSGPVAWAQFSPDGQSLLSVTERKRVQVWDWRKGRRLGPELRHDLVVFHASFSPDGRQILTASWDMLARIWDVAAGQIVAQFEHPSGLVSAAFAPDGKRIATACHDGVARVWEIGGSGRQRSLSLPHGNEVDVVVFSPDGQQVAVGGRGGVVRLWGLAPEDATTWKLPGRDVVWAEFSKDGGKLVTAGGGLDPNVCIWDGRSGKASGPQLSHSFAARKAIFNADGSRLLTIGEGRTAHLWNATTGQESIPAMQHANRVNDAAISPDNHRIATVCNDRAGYLWDATTGQRIARMPHSNGVTSVAFSPDGRVVATGARDRSARIWKAASGEPVSPPLPQPSTVRYLRFSPDGRRLATACYLQGATHGIAQLWDVTNGKPIGAPMTHRDDIRTVEFSSDGRWIATASGDHTARVWDALTGEPVSPLLSHQDAVLHAIFTPDGRRLATLAQNGEVRLWNALTGEPITMPIPHPHNHGLGRLSFSPNGRRLLIATGTDLAYARQFDPDPSSIAELLVKAQAFSGRQIHVSAGSIALDSMSLSNAWQQLHTARSRN